MGKSNSQHIMAPITNIKTSKVIMSKTTTSKAMTTTWPYDKHVSKKDNILRNRVETLIVSANPPTTKIYGAACVVELHLIDLQKLTSLEYQFQKYENSLEDSLYESSALFTSVVLATTNGTISKSEVHALAKRSPCLPCSREINASYEDDNVSKPKVLDYISQMLSKRMVLGKIGFHGLSYSSTLGDNNNND
ncbi:hypothetical protein BDA99DRAFT_543692 [Phascolomyces articulosus]|uniref:Uncharacterized protein n=1 Tax=Phascolomyces articulosus TaxID=60185 RepID=A0AAD5P7G5_9FUNG|nr:hypothetical protein BDA99DRAFT_543692 [Phascolomyces articulosus]